MTNSATRVVSERELLERPRKAKEVGELKENLEVYCDPHLFSWEVILTPLQKGKERRELEHEREEFEVHRNPRFRRSISLILLCAPRTCGNSVVMLNP